MVGADMGGERVEKLAHQRRGTSPERRLYAKPAPRPNLLLRRDLLIAYARLQHGWSLADIQEVFGLSRASVWSAIKNVKAFDDLTARQRTG